MNTSEALAVLARASDEAAAGSPVAGVIVGQALQATYAAVLDLAARVEALEAAAPAAP